MSLTEDLIRDEGLRLFVYDDATGQPIEKGYTLKGHPTIGVGRLLTKANGISTPVAKLLLEEDIEEAKAAARRLVPNLDSMPRPVIEGLENMAFNLGEPRLSKFVRMLGAIRILDFNTAADEALDSLWAKQVGPRATRIADLFRSAAPENY